MSSCASNSKNKKRFFLTLLLVLIFFSMPCATIYLLTLEKTNKEKFTSSAESKSKHMALNLGSVKPHTIFIGSSRTLFHIDTGSLSKILHQPSYNYGLNGHFIASYPYMVKQAVKHKPSVIVINLDVQELYSPIEPTKDLYLTDLAAYLTTHQNFQFIVTSFGYYLASFNLIRQHSTIIHQFIVGKKVFTNHENYHIINNSLSQQYGLCQPFRDERNVGAEVTLVECQNGDGILFGTAKLSAKKIQHLSTLNPHAVALLKYSLEIIKKNHIIPVVVFSPVYTENYIFDRTQIQKTLDVKLIDLTHYPVPATDWANENHLNAAGRNLFTYVLYQALQGSPHAKIAFYDPKTLKLNAIE